MTYSALDDLEVYGVIASGGMATIEYAGRATAAGTLEVVVKRPHARFASDSDFIAMFMDEARLSLRLRHANIVRTCGVLPQPSLALVLEYVPGESLFELLRLARSAHREVPPDIAAALLAGVLHGLHAAHETRGEDGQPLHIVHRDVTPENILVGADGIARVLDFGIAKAIGKVRQTQDGEFKGKPAYIAPEQLRNAPVTPRTDVYSAAVVLWEALAGRTLFGRTHDAITLDAVRGATVPALRESRGDIPESLERIVRRALAREPEERFETALAMARALETEVGVASQSAVMEWVEQLAGKHLRRRRALLQSLRDQWRLRATAAVGTGDAPPARTTAERSPAAAPCSTVGGAVARAIATTRAIGTGIHAAHAADAPVVPDADGCGSHVRFAGAAVVRASAAHREKPRGNHTSARRGWRSSAAALGFAAFGMNVTTAPSRATDAESHAGVAMQTPAPLQAPAVGVEHTPAPRALVVVAAQTPPPSREHVRSDLADQTALPSRASAQQLSASIARTRSADRRPVLSRKQFAQASSDTPPLAAITDFGPRKGETVIRSRLLLAERSATRLNPSPSMLDRGWGRR